MQKNKMRVLVACEFSGIVRDAFRILGHEAWSCDLLVSEREGPHIIADNDLHLLDIIFKGRWDMLIFHWPCTLLCNSGVRWLYGGGKGGKGAVKDRDRWERMEQSARMFRVILDSPVSKVVGENPIPHNYAAAIMGKPTQIIQPWQFGHGEIKATCLWIKNLPKLKATQIVLERNPRVHHEPPGPERWKNRSRTYQGIADAMAEQWGSL